jgi:hypothetical protein
VVEEGGGKNKVAQLVNPTTNAAANQAANPTVNVAATLPAMPKTTPPIRLVPNSRMLPLMQGRTLELNFHQYRPTTLNAVSVDEYKMKWR